MLVTIEPVMVKLVQLLIFDIKTFCQTSDLVACFKYGNRDALFANLVGCGQTGKSRSDDNYMRFLTAIMQKNLLYFAIS